MTDTERTASNAGEFTVSEISGALKRTVEDAYGYVRVRGEVSGYRGPHSSGHCYFSLKDEKARLEAVVWRGVFGKLKVKPEEGMEMIATGRISTFPGASKYQIIIDAIEPAGAGALMALLEARRKALAAEGLFDADRKVRPPFLPRVIGVVTSPTGAVIRDILHRLTDRFPVHVLVWPVRVQGEESAAEVAAAVAGFNRLQAGGAIPRPDTLIVARGGGSLEDLWGFNDEAVVRAVAASTIPVISAVGHETDTTLIDFVADIRAPTPTAAAEIAVPVRSELVAVVDDRARRLYQAERRHLDTRRSELRALARAMPAPLDLVASQRQRFDHAGSRLSSALSAAASAHRLALQQSAARLRPGLLRQSVRLGRRTMDNLSERSAQQFIGTARRARRQFDQCGERLAPGILSRALAANRKQFDDIGRRLDPCYSRTVSARRERLDNLWKLVQALSHQGVLDRGFVLVRDSEGKALTRAGMVGPGEALRLTFADGDVAAVAAGSAPPRPSSRTKRTPSPKDPRDQGTLL
ncbi:exodeoxyribonuclease VII large subunit [Amorphus orientalis]|uniref:Exodeoxyribonuclease 7 large subunit n=1 Tax=Amorphus orientalis TaxID=649198 RepID=A0AAE4ASQ7_9HYPH|nr:exodeoxyribonuclease VII large subunit [Amorphus orientalis]MDQ0316541.1 exodeoxyribonuclease VII large subunit [Amorphus orientalis]